MLQLIDVTFIKNPMFALVDCNNFYVSCERLFRPDLINKPVIVLSNNDGCVVARSNEAKALDIKMGVPYFEVKGLCAEHKVTVFSSNYTLYADLSQRVMSIIASEWPETEIYSIDEAFLDLSTLSIKAAYDFCTDLHRKIVKYTGIPVSIGIGKTKTLAKVSNYLAKKKLKIPVLNILGQNFWLKHILVSDIWGVGYKWAKKLNSVGIFTAHDLSLLHITQAKKMFNVVLQRTVMELNGVSCLGLEYPEPRQSIISSCSFGGLQSDYRVIKESIGHHCATAWGKMREQGLCAQYVSVFIYSNPFRTDLSQYRNSVGIRLMNVTDDIRILTRVAELCLKRIFKVGIQYHKSGVVFFNLISKDIMQKGLLYHPSETEIKKADALMTVITRVNNKYGARSLRLAADGLQKEWHMKRQLKSPNYTTCWNELPKV